MIWAGICRRGKTPLVFVEANMNVQAYTNFLDKYYFPFVEELYCRGAILQQDGAPAYSGRHTEDYFRSEPMDVMDWSAP